MPWKLLTRFCCVIQKMCPELEAPFISRILFAWFDGDDPLWKGLFLSGLMFLAALIQSVLLGQFFQRMFVVGMRVRTALTSAIYAKSLVLSNNARKESTLGEIVNLMSVDAQRFVDLMTYINLIWSAPFQIVLSVYFLWGMLGPSVMAGVVVMILMMPLNGVIATYSKKLQVKQMKLKDQRIKMMNEILSGVKVLKLYAWEKSFEEQILEIRDKEVRGQRRIAYLNASSIFLWVTAPFLVALASFATFVLIDEHNILDATTAFVSISLFNILRFPMSMLPNLITTMVMVSVSVKRINKYLNSEELEPYVTSDNSKEHLVKIQDGEFSWGPGEANVLRDININVKSGELVAVVGPVGSGKSSMLSALLGDMERQSGSVVINYTCGTGYGVRSSVWLFAFTVGDNCGELWVLQGSLAYVPQQAWIQNATLRDNILFSKPYNERKYTRIISSCALKPDLEILSGGDMTEIGEKMSETFSKWTMMCLQGINLSGGQKQRVSLARAVYSDAEILLLDDPLSAVDSHVGKHLFQHVIGPEGILKNKTRVLVTHNLACLPKVDRILVMAGGKIVEEGSYRQLLEKKGAFAEFLVQYLTEAGDEVADQPELVEEILETVGTNPELKRQISGRMRLLSETDSQSEPEQGTNRKGSFGASVSGDFRKRKGSEKSVKGKRPSRPNIKLIQAETAEVGKVKWNVYGQYFTAVGYWWTIAILGSMVGVQICSVGSNIWLSAWSNDKPINGTQDPELRDLRLGVYGGLGSGQGIFISLASFILAYSTLEAAQNLHKGLLHNILRSPMAFFDATPLGRILNRFSKDIDTVDVIIPMTIRTWFQCLMQVVGSLFVIAYSTPWFLLTIPPIGIIYYFIQVSLYEVFLCEVSPCEIPLFEMSLYEVSLWEMSLYEVSLWEMSLYEISLFEMYLYEVSLWEISLYEVFLYEVSPCEISLFRMSLYEVSLWEMSLYEVSLWEISLYEVFLWEGSPCEISLFEMSLYEVSLWEISLYEVFLCEVSPCEISLFEMSLYEVSLWCSNGKYPYVRCSYKRCPRVRYPYMRCSYVCKMPLCDVSLCEGSRQLKRLESITRSPIYSHFSETLTGVSTIRAYRSSERFATHSDNLVDVNQMCYYPSVIANRWLAIRLEFCGNCIVLFAALFATLGRGVLDEGTVGLAVSSAFQIINNLNWMVRMNSELETNIVAVERILEYSNTPTEAEWESRYNKPSPEWPEQGEMVFRSYSTSYRPGGDLVLKDVTFTVKPGEKVGIVGRTGAGKSSLTLALFRIIEPVTGNILVDNVDIARLGLHDLRSRLTIIPQDPVLFSGNLRLNLDPFSNISDSAMWNALDMAHLKAFVSSLPLGLDSPITEGGDNLSVGQRQLVCLARALLRKTRVLVLDEATAAVDVETDDLIQTTIRAAFKHCTVVTIAHRLNTVMDYDSFRTSFYRLLMIILQYYSKKDLLDEVKWNVYGQYFTAVGYWWTIAILGSMVGVQICSVGSNIWLSAWSNDKPINGTQDPELRDLRLGVYGGLGSGQGIFISLASFILAYSTLEAAQNLHKGLLHNILRSPMAFFDATPLGRILNRFSKDIDTVDVIIPMTIRTWFQCLMQVVGSLFVIAYSTPWFLLTIPPIGIIYYFIQVSLYEVFLCEVSPCEISLFEMSLYEVSLWEMSMCPYGRCPCMRCFYVRCFPCEISLFEMSLYDVSLWEMSLYEVFLCEVSPCEISLFEMSLYEVSLWEISLYEVFLCEVSPCEISLFEMSLYEVSLWEMSLYEIFYVASSRQLKRLESITRSPIYSHFSETLTGVSTIRAYRSSERFATHSDNLVDVNQMCYYPSVIANRWLAIRLEFCGNCIVLFAALFATLGRGVLDEGTVGLAVSSAFQIINNLNWMVRMNSELETNIVAVERILEYSNTPTEAEWESRYNKPSPEWPEQGEMVFRSYSTSYRPGGDLVLKDVTFTVKPGEKVGIVGRTGAGKSSLTLALFRIIEPVTGNILVDNVDIARLGLHDLRSRLTIIPQDPVLFSGNLRLNLDPFSNISDSAMWNALDMAHLKAFVSSLPLGLDSPITEGGDNLSVGQRQLVCLARALLRKTRVLVLDEATAAVDVETDDLIQTTIRAAFKHCTVVTIAHRLNTVMDYDRYECPSTGEKHGIMIRQ
ncbi:ABCC3 [Cordylochernes scorpioides]|uniref:ABCC3 n=1 Tax=Cordylochernes scorpioides TaxID=51811 RepID=A0ABY6LHQ9_9ARAC|nr:ABCC3 [Cordylochernes scorpioides]